MLELPERGIQRSVRQHNVEFEMFCDWLEACALFSGSFTGSDVVDVLRENEIYKTQDFAWEIVNSAITNLKLRNRLMGDGYPVSVTGTRLSAKDDWEYFSAYSFCLVLSLPMAFPAWSNSFGKDFTEQGDLFEKLTAESVAASLTGWSVHRTGWTKSTPNKLKAVVAEVASKLGEATGELLRWTKATANEAGLDLLCYRPFPDGRVGVPVYLLQCASGADWKNKLHTPDLKVWTKIVTFAAIPRKALSMPFALDENDFAMRCNVVDGLLFDRHRLLAPGLPVRKWVTDELDVMLRDWSRPRIASLPAA